MVHQTILALKSLLFFISYAIKIHVLAFKMDVNLTAVTEIAVDI